MRFKHSLVCLQDAVIALVQVTKSTGEKLVLEALLKPRRYQVVQFPDAAREASATIVSQHALYDIIRPTHLACCATPAPGTRSDRRDYRGGAGRLQNPDLQ